VTARSRTEAVERRLVTMRRSVGQLGDLGPVGRERLDRDPAAGLVIERLLALLADLAFEINRQVAAALGDVPATPATAFAAAARAGLIDERLAAALMPPDGPYHVLVQLYLDTEPERVGGVVSAAVAGYREYVRQVTRWTAARAVAPGLPCACFLLLSFIGAQVSKGRKRLGAVPTEYGL
jgi:uncharacterized protein YutE (UPF0331/DUF86 family)